MPRRKTPPLERFCTFINAMGVCWEWTGRIHKDTGYGYFNDGTSRRVLAHVFAWESLIGPVPAGLELDHRCRNRACVNPDHLEPVTHAENMARAIYPARHQTHCKNGHPLSGENLRIETNGARRCRACRRAAGQTGRAARKAA